MSCSRVPTIPGADPLFTDTSMHWGPPVPLSYLTTLYGVKDMGRPPAFVRKLDAMVREKMDEGLRARYVKQLRSVNMQNLEHLMDAGMEIRPELIGTAEVNYLRSQYPTNRGNIRNQQMHIQYLGIYLNWMGNSVVQDMKIHWPEGINPHTDWLLPEQMEHLRLAIQGNPTLHMLFHLEADMGLRRVEVSRLTLQDIGPDHIRVLGKGRGDGKPRKITKHPDWDTVFSEYMDHRDSVIRKAMAVDHSLAPPDGLMVYHHMGRLGVCQRTALDRMIGKMNARSGLEFGHHTLRRTFGRELWKAGVPLETIANILGHSDPRVTIRYLGINLDDQAAAMRKLYRRQSETRAAMNANPLITPNLHQSA